MASLRRSLFITFCSSSGAALLKFITSVLVARILSPSEIGVFSMTVVLVNIAHIFRDFGVGSYIQREPDLTPDKIRSAFGVALATSWLLAALLFGASGYISRWFSEPQMAPVMHVFAAGFLLIPFGAIGNALLTRELAADKQALINTVGTVSFCISCVGLAKLGLGSMSLAWANLINIVACALMYIPLRPKGLPWLPAFQHWSGVARFGLGSLVSNCTIALNNAVPDLLLGKLGSAHAVGLLSRANSTVAIFAYVAGGTVSYGSVSYLSQAHHRGEPLAPMLSHAISLLTGIGWPALALTAALGREITLALYGHAWLDSVPAILPLALAGMIGMLFHFTPMALTAIGRPYLGAVPVMITLLSRIAFGALLFDGRLDTFAWTICLATMATAPMMAVQQSRHFKLETAALARAVSPSAIVTLACVATAEVAILVLPDSVPAAAQLCIMALPIMLVWYAALRLTTHPILPEVHRLGYAIQARLQKKTHK
ncbi:oligosaccharide flippase family protein [Pseudoduganella namucuonensis]|uniref:Membrane protein involved in the export of O-antigen and teichoic acid n=1 Tax=Pseudoduganella namucuonensis TaxID=1035707 RepID=A0A1I7GE78_9BURK|nr:oligosaccharide flippase family protein [Pseudoduganella namucuonensis]SFU46772.1 Membrane protein involved in the export of O-antigen and teichoic acid [Pseudoduganella namucuonensis]